MCFSSLSGRSPVITLKGQMTGKHEISFFLHDCVFKRSDFVTRAYGEEWFSFQIVQIINLFMDSFLPEENESIFGMKRGFSSVLNEASRIAFLSRSRQQKALECNQG